ncbi:hypothetical protein DFS34DRAFT_593149 [Phlyctochytrium arcticum]|nr:hypothetical protein DFS34DRAFT_593149 [Phlyctochytrium arcticum]
MPNLLLTSPAGNTAPTTGFWIMDGAYHLLNPCHIFLPYVFIPLAVLNMMEILRSMILAIEYRGYDNCRLPVVGVPPRNLEVGNHHPVCTSKILYVPSKPQAFMADLLQLGTRLGISTSDPRRRRL